MRWAVRITAGHGAGHVFTGPRSIVAGRGDDCGLRVPDPEASRVHCRFTIEPPHVEVRDLGSRNGTRVNGVLAEQSELADGDEVRVGSTTLRITVSPAEFPGYALEHELGRGAQGVVFLARDTTTGEPVALKVLHDVRPDTAGLFLREIANVRALRHPNIVDFRGVGDEPVPFLVSTYCPGGSVDRLGRLTAREAVPIILGVLAGLAYAHGAELPEVRLADRTTTTARGLVHRDVKPQNVLLDGGIARLADFGLAKAFDVAGFSGHTRTGELGGSLEFVPRAQVLNYRYAPPWVDVWATAATLYWMLTGRPPRDFPLGADPVAVVLRENPVPVRAREPSVPPRLAELVDRTLTEETPMSAEDFAKALDEVRE
ncbi:FHA domain-containing serine/threonine-protein kinase [Amycolatopsis sp.]|uniref:FHA domain-containing serine/threonine-protein kinase n=1 Tax=Amycolatopsis sp. TaxID=37632 RepID=UPI002D80935B|nr:FHA domain-containing serine/threonine-protein kinase [Amycolatopsis sp.]HET6705150.1 FHA domain-containing serine/threonine-protein kinase [Amycolatopsis sp.]